MVKRGDQKIEIVWNVSVNTKYGYAGFFGREIHKVSKEFDITKKQSGNNKKVCAKKAWQFLPVKVRIGQRLAASLTPIPHTRG